MFKGLFSSSRKASMRLLLTVTMLACVVGLALVLSLRAAREQSHAISARVATVAPKDAARKMEGNQAQDYLEQTSEGQSLMKALEVQRFGLKWQEQSPF